MVNLGTQFGRGIIKVARRVRAGRAQGKHSPTVFPYTGLLRFLLSPRTQIKLCFTMKMPDRWLNLLFLPCGRMRP